MRHGHLHNQSKNLLVTSEVMADVVHGKCIKLVKISVIKQLKQAFITVLPAPVQYVLVAGSCAPHTHTW